jgi:two-component sensor histidine kinase/PAS domain-containing protein
MLTLAEIVAEHAVLADDDVEWLQDLVREGQIVADLSLADIAMWVRTSDGAWMAVALFRASTASTVFYRDIVGTRISDTWEKLFDECERRGVMVEPTEPIWFDETATQVRAIPIRRSGGSAPIAVLTRHTLVSGNPTNRQSKSFIESAEQIYSMIAEGAFPDPSQRELPKLGAPRASDGLIKLDREGTVTYASPNALSVFNRLGYSTPMEGTNLVEVVTRLGNAQELAADEMLPMVIGGRVPWQADFRVGQMTTVVRGIPLRQDGERIGAILLLRDVTDLRRQERELVSKNATIREIHHRVKNNLQTVASLLRIQSRRTKTADVKDALSQAMRRVEAIAVVHDALASGLAQSVDFDDVAARVAPLAAEVANTVGPTIRPVIEGQFGFLPSEFATPLAVVLTELITNAVEHGLPDRDGGAVVIRAERSVDRLKVSVTDNGRGIDLSTVGQGLGTQIVTTLVKNELTAEIDWANGTNGGTVVSIDIPLRYVAAATGVK